MRALYRLSLAILATGLPQAMADDDLKVLEQLAEADPKPFVIVEGSGKDTQSRAQGVVVSSKGLVLSVGHIAWIEADKAFTDRFRISFRGKGEGLPSPPAHVHRTAFLDREGRKFLEHYFPATLKRQGDTRFVGDGDLAIFQIEAKAGFPTLDFFSKEKPSLDDGETLHLCHFTFPHKPGDPFFLINPVEVVGVAQTSWGIQYLARGYYRVGSSGGAILKDGKLIGIQSSAYTVNATGVGEIPLGLISFQPVWEDLFDGILESSADDAPEGSAESPRNDSRPRRDRKEQTRGARQPLEATP